ncbi:MAG: hypothetical protein ACJ79O_10725 [Myxococcales bacterium]
MPNLQVKDVPPELYRKIKRLAEAQGKTVRDFVLEAVCRQITRADFHARLARRKPVDLGRPAGRILEEVRAEREAEWENSMVQWSRDLPRGK